jgi:hypothetical protein
MAEQGRDGQRSVGEVGNPLEIAKEQREQTQMLELIRNEFRRR